METMIRKTYEAQVKGYDEENLTVEHFISTESVDRYGDIVRAKGMKINGKPVVLMQHGRGPLGAEPIAKPLGFRKNEKFGDSLGIVANTKFFPDDTGKRLFEKNISGYMPNWSIGFRPLLSRPRKDSEGNETDGIDYVEWELLEYSIVAVPAQADAQTPPGKKGQEELVYKGMFDVAECPECSEKLEGDSHFCQSDFKCKEKGCDGPIVSYHDGEKEIGRACQKCEPEEMARLSELIKVPATPDLADLLSATQVMTESVGALTDVVMKLVDKIEALPTGASPGAPTDGKDGDDAGNSPEPKVLQADDPAVLDMIRGAVQMSTREFVKTEIDKIRGKVN